MARQRMTAQQWRDLIARQRSSGLSIEDFCRHHQLASSTFFAWRRKLGEQDASAFVELTPAVELTPPPRPLVASIELMLPGDVVVHVREGFDAMLLRQIVEALR